MTGTSICVAILIVCGCVALIDHIGFVEFCLAVLLGNLFVGMVTS